MTKPSTKPSTSDLAMIGIVFKTAYDAWLVEYQATYIAEGEDILYDAASSLVKAKQCLLRYARDAEYTSPFRWEKGTGELYRLYAQAPEEPTNP